MQRLRLQRSAADAPYCACASTRSRELAPQQAKLQEALLDRGTSFLTRKQLTNNDQKRFRTSRRFAAPGVGATSKAKAKAKANAKPVRNAADAQPLKQIALTG